MYKFFCCLILCLLVSSITNSIFAQYSKEYENSYKELSEMLNGTALLSFKKAVFTTENTFLDNELKYSAFNEDISIFGRLCLGFKESNQLENYKFADKAFIETVGSVFKVLTDTTEVILSDNQTAKHLPFVYNFDDIFGEHNWANTRW